VGDDRTLSLIAVYYSEAMVAESHGFSPSAGKPKAVVASWRAKGFAVEILAPEPASRADFYRAHDSIYVDSVLDLTSENGFANRSASVANSLPYTSGAMLSAAKAAIANGSVAAAPCSGFHHAGFDFGGGFCTFNGLMVAATALHARGLADRVGILDFDQHYGDGTEDIRCKLKLDWIKHITAGKTYRRPSQALKFLSCIPDMVWEMRDCDVILYQAGADPHVDDPLGGWLTTAQLAARDQIVFSSAKAIGVPVAWNLAGGYQTPLSRVIAIHDNTMAACTSVYSECGVWEVTL
jgi:acetoin utilization deacetylase AcuC-like enzyme